MSRVPGGFDESKAIEECLKGRKEAFEQIVEKYKKSAYYMALRIVGNAEDALDLSQEAFVKAYKALKIFRLGSDFKVWFYQILRNTCISHLRSRRRRVENSFGESQPDIIDTSTNPETEAGRSEMKTALWKAINNLTLIRKEALLLREFEGLSYSDIAKITGATIEQVKSRIHYARNKLMEDMEKYIK